MESRVFIVGLIVGILATVTMDVVVVIALRRGIAGKRPCRTGPDLIGRCTLVYWLWRTRHRQHSMPSSTERPPPSSPGFSCSHRRG